jgi:transcription termination/antitermination protein NusG
MQITANWYALYTRPRWEKKVVTLLTKKGVETYCPFNKAIKQWSDRKKLVEEPLFKSYVFVRIAETDHLTVKSADGVINIVHWLGKPAIIPDGEIEIIKRFLYDFRDIKLEKTEVNVDDKVRILNGPMMMMEGNVVEIKYNTVKVILPSLGYTMIAEINKANVEKIDVLSNGNEIRYVPLTASSTQTDLQEDAIN